MIQWYNLLVSNGETDFVETEKQPNKAEESYSLMYNLEQKLSQGKRMHRSGYGCTFALRQFIYSNGS